MAAAASPVSSTVTAVQCDDMVTVCFISAFPFMLGDVLHEALGHACFALLTVSPSGLLTTVAWSSAYDSRLVDAAGTLVNLAAAAVFWLLLQASRRASIQTRLFLVTCCAVNLFSGTGYFFFSGVTNFGDWAPVIDGLPHHALWRVLLIVGGFAAYWGAVLVVGTSMVQYVGISLQQGQRFFRIVLAIYLSVITISTLGGLMNPLGLKYVLLSALPATAGADSGLLWMRYYIPRKTVPIVPPDVITRHWLWNGISAVAAVFFVFILGRGIMLHR